MVRFIKAFIIEHEGEEWHVRPERIGDHDYVVVSANDYALSKFATGSAIGTRNTTLFDALKKHRLEALSDKALPPLPGVVETPQQKKRRMSHAKERIAAMNNVGALPTEVDVALPAILKDGNEVAAATCLHLISEADSRSQIKVRLEVPAIQYIIAALRMEENYRSPHKKRDHDEELDGQWRVTWAADRDAYVARAGTKCRTFRPKVGCDKATMYGHALHWVRSELVTSGASITDVEVDIDDSQASASQTASSAP